MIIIQCTTLIMIIFSLVVFQLISSLTHLCDTHNECRHTMVFCLLLLRDCGEQRRAKKRGRERDVMGSNRRRQREKERDPFDDERLIEKDLFDFFLLPTYNLIKSLSFLHHITGICHLCDHGCRRRRIHSRSR